MKFKEQDDYSIAAWTNDLVNLIKVRGFLSKKEDAFLVYTENAKEFLDYYLDQMSPREAYNDFANEIDV